MKKVPAFIFFIFATFGFSTCYGQTASKKDLYLFFKEDRSKDIFKTYEYLKPNNLAKNDIKLDLYCYIVKDRKDGKRLTLAYLPLDPGKFKYVGTDFVKDSVKTIDDIKDIDAIKYDTFDKRFPFKKVYIVEETLPGKYKVIEVHSYLGTLMDGYRR